jgi:subtilisin family serine protease
MALNDYNSSLPIRTESDLDSKTQVKIHDFTDPDGVDKQTEVSEKLLHIRAFGQDSDGTKVQLRLSQLGAPNPDGVYSGTDNKTPASSGLIAHVRAATPADTDLTKRITGVTSGTVHALDVSMHNSDGTAITETTPLPVTIADSAGTEVNDFKDADGGGSGVAANASDDHLYTVTALKTLKLTQIEGSASGRAKMEVAIETGPGTNTYVTKWVMSNSTSTPNMSLIIKEPISVAAGVRVRVRMTNRDNQPQSLYSTISGHEV